ncbi:hypothetical protein DFS34DRAFT_351449 [Phlyctochytrium arcticum]|nr:hypothetical protein DFS34DRAFT_351449 [Phlyctochytrium arcticum]
MTPLKIQRHRSRVLYYRRVRVDVCVLVPFKLKMILSRLDELLDHYTAACEVYKAEIKVLQKELRDRVDAFELLEKTWHQTHETNLIVLKSLEEMQHQNETLMSRLDEVNKSSKESAGKISTMQIRMEDKRRALTVKAAQVETMHQQLQQPEPAVKIEMYHLFAGAGAILFIAFIAHYIWLVVQVTKLSSQTR